MTPSLSPLAPGLPPGHAHGAAPSGMRGAMAAAVVVACLYLLGDAAAFVPHLMGIGPPRELTVMQWIWRLGGVTAALGLLLGALLMLRRSSRAMGVLAFGVVAFGGLTLVKAMTVVEMIMFSLADFGLLGWEGMVVTGIMLALVILWWAIKMGTSVWAYRQTKRPEVAEWIVEGQP